MWLSEREQRTLAWLGLAGLAGAALLCWQQRPKSWRIISSDPAQWARTYAWDRQLDRAGRIDINTAQAGELDRLPGIGPSLAGRIVAHRNAHGRFHSVEQLAEVDGIGPGRADALRPHVTVE